MNKLIPIEPAPPNANDCKGVQYNNILHKINGIIPKAVTIILNELNQAGYEAYIVGGCVRDAVLNKSPHDWDICTNAKPDETIAIFDNKYKVFDIGKRYGTVAVLIDGLQYEITTYRIDGNYFNNRHPDNIEYTTNILADLERRDFTINSIAYCPITVNSASKPIAKGLIDPFDGILDIDSKTIKCVGNPNDRFAEDGLRLMRGLRFSAQLQFNIEKSTSEAIHANKQLLDSISKERIQVELCKILMSKDCGVRVLNNYADVFSVIVPEINSMIGFKEINSIDDNDLWDHTLICLNNENNGDENDVSYDLICRLAILLHDIGKPYCKPYCYLGSNNIIKYLQDNGICSLHSMTLARSRLSCLKFDNKTIGDVEQLIEYYHINFIPSKTVIKHLLNILGKEQFLRLMIIKEHEIDAQNYYSNFPIEVIQTKYKKLNRVIELYQAIISNNECYELKYLNINGVDLIELGIKQGKAIGKLLNILLNNVIEDKLPNQKDKLIEFAKNWIDAHKEELI